MVVLSHYFTPATRMRLARMGPLLDQILASYPNVQERPPLSPIASDDEGPEPSLLDEDSDWPVPLVEFSDALGERAVAFQADRLQVRWAFDEEGSPYPGFTDLVEALAEWSAVFQEHVGAVLGEALVPTGASCLYVNDIDSEEFNRAAAESPDPNLKRQTQFLGARRVDYAGTRISVGSRRAEGAGRLDFATDREPGASHFTIFSFQPVGEGSLSQAIEIAHDELIEAFVALTTDTMRLAWGEK